MQDFKRSGPTEVSPIRIGIIDYGMGNLRSIQKAIERLGAGTIVSSDVGELKAADAFVLPGVGAFGDAMENLEGSKLVPFLDSIVEGGQLVLGICLGLQLVLSESEEMGLYRGLGYIPGRVVRFQTDEKVPQIGWNNVEFTDEDHFLVRGIPQNTYFYFVHSYHATLERPGENSLGFTEYGGTRYASIVRSDAGNLVATQFHPEKSGKWGLRMLGNFLEHVKT
ncbi:MAG: imidazole glycerol phosphate synthase subunit HisH [Promethearchaeota archaeon]